MKPRLYRDRYWRYNQAGWILEGQHPQGDFWMMRFNSFELAQRYLCGIA